MANTLNAKFTLAGAPARADYAATSFIVIPNAPPIPTKVIRTNDNQGKTLTFEFKDGIDTDTHILDDLTASIIYADNLYSVSKDLTGMLEVNLLEGTYKGNFKAILPDDFGREWQVEGTIDITVEPLKKA
jgi:hypothetical protein